MLISNRRMDIRKIKRLFLISRYVQIIFKKIIIKKFLLYLNRKLFFF